VEYGIIQVMLELYSSIRKIPVSEVMKFTKPVTISVM